MELDNEYLNLLVKPLEGKIGLKPSEYFSSLNQLGIIVADERHYINQKFKMHFLHAIELRLIVNPIGSQSLSDFGVSISADGMISLIDNKTIKKGQAAQPTPVTSNVTTNTINVGGSFNGNFQSGESNTASTTSAPENNSIFKWVLDNIIGVVVSGIILALLLAWLGLNQP